jgi:hypothetical protein
MILLKLLHKEQIKLLLKKDKIYLGLCNSKDPEKLDDAIDLQTQSWYSILDLEEEEVAGLFITTPSLGTTICFHMGLYKDYRGRSNPIARECFEQIAPRNDSVFICPIAEKNIQARKAVEKCGFIHKTTIEGGCSNDNLMIYSEV